MAIRVLIADDHLLFRAGIRRILASLEDMEVVGEAADGDEAIRLTADHQPDVVLVDIAMPGLSGIETARRIRANQPRSRVIILSMHEHEQYVVGALQAGAVGYLLKNASPQELETAVRAAARGETFISPAIAKYVIEDYVRRAGREESPERLTRRQREILQLIAEGLTTKAIAQKLGISTKTVETHRAELMDRLGIHDVAGLVRYAIRTGLVTPDA